ncbi:uncharacterized protein DNG_09341 [Cephalotrichum gorgonifer]|uniref:Uncharacterized protein n=1 Tax=Cephalotrichum gorgonifer TaxID=2041049 RepID=A0AAE8N737_9PEZI|nr:uncharacterized protein DNG_09341 [Cephalotrichum gorgonifer]
MAQGPLKARAHPGVGKKSKVTKKGKTGKGGLAKATKKFTAALVGRTEQMLGERAGHLEIIGKGKKTPKEERINGKGGLVTDMLTPAPGALGRSCQIRPLG